MSKELRNLKVAIVSDHCFNFAGAMSVTKTIGEVFKSPDYFFLIGDGKKAKEYFNTEKIYFSSLNRLPFLRKYYRYTYFLWPIYIESFDLSSYDLVISSSFSTAHGAITGIDTVHLAYIHTPMRYAWDLTNEYFKRSFILKRAIVKIFLNIIRIWDISASNRPKILISNSNFVKRRILKYWKRDVDMVLFPPVKMYTGNILTHREDYFVSGAPFEINKGGDFLLECAKELGFNLLVIGLGENHNRLKRRYSKYKNISFLGWVDDKRKYEILSKAKGYICAGVEDFGIFTVEAISCGTPVLAYMEGGSLDIVEEGISGMFFKKKTKVEFKKIYERFNSRKWNYIQVSKRVGRFNSARDFKRKIKGVIRKEMM